MRLHDLQGAERVVFPIAKKTQVLLMPLLTKKG